MPESSFSTGNQITSPEIAVGKPVTAVLLAKLKGRDVELMDLMSAFGGPASTVAGSAVSYEGDVVITTSQNLSGYHFYNSLTINPGVIVTADKPLFIQARSFVDITGATITSVGKGALGGVAVAGPTSAPGSDGFAGVGGGGGKNNNNVPGGAGGGFVFAGITLAGGASQLAGQALTNEIIFMLLRYTGVLSGYWGGGGGGAGAWSDAAAGNGGAGGGVINIAAPAVIATGGTITSNGAAGSNSAGDGGGGGGGGGYVGIDTKSLTGGTVTANGGAGGLVVTGSAGDTAGGQGGNGVVQINIFA